MSPCLAEVLSTEKAYNMMHSLTEIVAKILFTEGTKHLLIEGRERLVNRTEHHI